MQKRGGTDQIYLLIILQKQMKQKQYARMKTRKAENKQKRQKCKWQPRRTEEKKTHWMLQEAPFSTLKKKKFGIFALKIRTLHPHATQ